MPKYPGFDITAPLGDPLNEYGGGGDMSGGFFDGALDGYNEGTYEVSTCWLGGQVYVAFVEADGSGFGRGPIVKTWDGSAWVLVGTDMEPAAIGTLPYIGGGVGDVFGTEAATGDRYCPSRPAICTDGTTLFVAYSIRVGAPTPDGEGNWDARALVVKYFDGSDWVLITEQAAETFNTWFGTGLDADPGNNGLFGSTIAVGATPDNAGIVYVSWYEEGPQSGLHGHNAHNWRQRWHVRGFDTGGGEVYDHDLWAVDFPGGFHDVTPGRFPDNRFARGNGTLYLLYADLDLGGLAMLDVLADTVTTVPVDDTVNFEGSPLSDTFGVNGVTATAPPYTPAGGAETIYFGSLQWFGVAILPAQVAADESGAVQVVHNDELTFTPTELEANAFITPVLDGIHPIDDKNLILVLYGVWFPGGPDYDGATGYYDGHTFLPGVWHENCGPAVKLGFNTSDPDHPVDDSDTRRVSSQYDPDAQLLYVAATRNADGMVVVFGSTLVTDKYRCGTPGFDDVVPR